MSESQFVKMAAANKQLRAENEAYKAMKAGVSLRIADLDAEIERLTSALLHVEQLHSISEARKDAEIKRLRKLLRQCQPFVDRLQPPTLDLSWVMSEKHDEDN